MAKGKTISPAVPQPLWKHLSAPRSKVSACACGMSALKKEGPDWFLRVLIDRDEPLDTDTCEAVSRAIDPILDEADPIDQSYYLEVGGPGLGRRLTRPEHYEQLKGQKCAAHLIRPDEQGSPRCGGHSGRAFR